MANDSEQNAIRELAYAKWEAAGCPCGDGVEFWLEAEMECLVQDSSDSASEAGAGRKSAAASFAPADPPPLKLTKVAGQVRKKAS